jgi:CDP-diacylglycerol--glycerol-3-phosphate 3-phosphatidyltransferase
MGRNVTVTYPSRTIDPSRVLTPANALTLGRIAVTPLLIALILTENPSWESFWLGWVLGGTDLVDGRLARRSGPTRSGAFLDPLADKVLALGCLFALVWIDRFPVWPVLLITARELGISAYRSYWARRGLAIPARRSAKFKTWVQGLAIAAALAPPLEGSGWVADAMLWVAVAFTVVTGLQYVVDGRAALRSTGER